MLLVMMALRGVGYGFNAVLGQIFTPDCVEYGHYQTGIRSEGISFSLQTFISKLMAAVVSSLSMFILAAAGFEESLGAAQSAATTSEIWNMTTYIPAIGSAVSLVILFVFYKLKESDVQIMARYNNGEITKEECDSLMARKY